MENRKGLRSDAVRWIVVIVSLFLMGIVGSGCGGNGMKKVKKVTFRVSSDTDANNGRPVYLLVRGVNKKDFLVEYYDDLAELLHGNSGDESVITTSIIFPGEKKKIKVDRPEDLDIGLYGMFTSPGNKWKLRLEAPLKRKYDIRVQKNNLKDASEPDEDEDDS